MALPAGFVPDEPAPQALPAGFVPDAPAPVAEAKPASFADELKSHLKSLAKPFVDIGKGALAANDFAARAITHPVDTFGGGKAGATLREGMRGVNSNIPFARDAVEAMGGPPASSPEDAAAAPGAQAFGSFAGAPVAGMEGQLLGKGLSLAGRGVTAAGEASVERSAARAAETSTPIRDAVGKAATEVKKNAKDIARDALLGQITGHGGAVGATSAALRVGAPLAKAAGVALDEGTAAMFRKFLARGSAPAEYLPPAAPTAAGAPMYEPAVSPELTAAAHAAPPLPARAPMRLLPAISEENPAAPVSAVANETAPPAWEPSKFDDKWARKLKMSTEQYRTMMNDRLQGAHKTINNAAASSAAKGRAIQILRGRTNVPEPGDVEAAAP